DFAAHSYGFRPGRGCKDALRRVQELLTAGYVHVVDADLKSYFDTIPQDRLVDLIRRKVADGRVLALIEAFLKEGVLDGLSDWTRQKSRNKLDDTIRSKTRRNNGHSLAVIVANVNRTLVGWFGYFKHSLRRSLATIDSWVRMRLRSILRRRAGLRGRGRGDDHHRW